MVNTMKRLNKCEIEKRRNEIPLMRRRGMTLRAFNEIMRWAGIADHK